MAESGELGEIQQVDLRTVWPHELDFSGWLKQNMDYLNDQVNWDLDPDSVRQEVTKGALRVDMLLDATAPDTEDRFPVVIENQLGPTDGSHLAGVMTYKRAAVSIARAMKQFVVATKDIARNIAPFPADTGGKR